MSLGKLLGPFGVAVVCLIWFYCVDAGRRSRKSSNSFNSPRAKPATVDNENSNLNFELEGSNADGPLAFDYHIWDGSFREKAEHGSYLTADKDNTKEVNNLLKLIHANQFPGKSKCSSRRLLLLDMSDASFEGIGSVMREIMFALATAVHSNRTLIWGLHMPMLFRYSHELIINEDEFENIRLDIPSGASSMLLNCKANDIGEYISGPFRCFFHPLSHCSLDDVSYQEIIDYSSGRQFDDHSRLMRNDLRRSVSLYQPPFGLFEYLQSIEVENQQGERIPALPPTATDQNHLWSAAVAAFVFRLKSDVVKSFIRRNAESFPFSEALLNKMSLPAGDLSGVVWGAHIRHGDLKANKDIYPYKKLFEFEEYFEAARAHSFRLGYSPAYLYIATDSHNITGLHAAYAAFNSRNREGWSNSAAPPELLVLDNDHRFRTAVGSHAVAAGGGCVVEPKLAQQGLKRCTVLPEIVKGYQSARDPPRPEMMMRVKIEAIEDIFLLSQCEVLFGSGSSYYSSVSALLLWAHSSPDNFVDRVVFLDQEKIDIGLIPTAYLPVDHRVDNSMNDLNTILTSGAKKWEFETMSFVTGLQQSNFQHGSLGFNPWSLKLHMRMHNMLPYLPPRLFYLESKMWLARIPYTPVLRGHCPKAFSMRSGGSVDQQRQQLLDYVSQVVNLGVDHFRAEHPNQALQCWFSAIDAINSYPEFMSDNRIKDAYEIVSENAGTFRESLYSRALPHYRNLLDYINTLLSNEALELKTGEYYEKHGFNPNLNSPHNPLIQDNGRMVQPPGMGGGGMGNQLEPVGAAGAGGGSGRLRAVSQPGLADPVEENTVKPFDYFFRRHQKNEMDRGKYRGLDDLVEEAAMLEHQLAMLIKQKEIVDAIPVGVMTA